MSTNVSPVSSNSFSQISSKGVILTHNGTSAVSLAPGSNGQILSSVSSAASGLGYVALSATLPTSYHNAIVSSTLTTTAANILFTGLTTYSPYKYLKIVGVTRNDSGSYNYTLNVNVNSVTGSTSQYYNQNANQGDNYWTANGLEANGTSGYTFYPYGSAPSNNPDPDEWGFVEILASGSQVGNSSLIWKGIGFQTSIGTNVFYQRGYTSNYSHSGGMNSILIKPDNGSFIAGTSFVLYVYK